MYIIIYVYKHTLYYKISIKKRIYVKMKYQLKSQTIGHESAKLRFPGSNPGDASKQKQVCLFASLFIFFKTIIG